MRKRGKALSKYPATRILIIWVFEVAGLIVMALLLPDLEIDRVSTAIWVVAATGLLNALLWPILSRVLLPVAVFTAGLFILLLNGFIFWLSGQFVEGFWVDNLWTAALASLGITAINIILSTLFTIDDDGSYYRNVVRRRMRRSMQVEETDVPGVLFLEIDGLAKPVLEKAMEEGYAPTMKRWLDEGQHKLVAWETDLSSQTSASQAGILHGNNADIPAFRWYDRQRRIIVASSNPDEVARLERERSNGSGLLVDDGASRGNLLSGDAPNVMNTASVIKDLSRFHTGDFYAYFVNPYNFPRTLLLFIWDIILERYRFWQNRRKDVQPRLDKQHRNFKYALIRGVTTIILRDLNIYTLIGDMYAGIPSAYSTFVGYDEVAHHSGVESMDAFDTLYKIDQQFARLESAAEQAPRPYRFVILSDHGQSGGLTFKQRYGKSLDQLIQELAAEYEVQGGEETGEGYGHVNAFLSDVMENEKRSTARRVAGALKRRIAGDQEGGELTPTDGKGAASQENDRGDLPQIVVLASGNLGLAYGTERTERATLELIESYYPGLLDGLVGHEGIGFVMAGSQEHGPVVIGAKGRNYLAEGRVEGQDPLQDFGPRAAEHLLREDSFSNCPDLLINSFYDAETNEVAAFEELIGCHGGMGGYQTQPFLMYPAEWQLTDEELVGAADVFHQLKEWLSQVTVDLDPAADLS